MKHTDQTTDFEKWLRDRSRGLAESEVSSEFLAAQRRRIYRRLDEPRPNGIPIRWALSLAMLLLMIAGGLTFEQRQHKTAPSAPPADDQLFSDLAAIEQSNEPRAIQPIRGLFQE